MGQDEGQGEVQRAARLNPDVVVEVPDLAQQILALHKAVDAAVEYLTATVARIDERLIETNEKIDDIAARVASPGRRLQIIESVVRRNQEMLSRL